MYVDNNEEAVQYYKTFLLSKGFPCEAFSDPRKALQIYEESLRKRCCRKGFSLVVTAVQMPGMDGGVLSRAMWDL